MGKMCNNMLIYHLKHIIIFLNNKNIEKVLKLLIMGILKRGEKNEYYLWGD